MIPHGGGANMSRWRKAALSFAVLATLLSLVLAAAGCAGRAGPQGAKPSGPVYGGKLKVALGVEIISLDPHMSAGTPAEMVRRHIYEGLVYADEKNEIHPCLAERWEASADGKTWTFYLRKGVKFHDGTDFNAQAVKASLERLLDPAQKSNRRYLYTNIGEVRVVSPDVVQIVTKEPSGVLLALLAFGGAHVISPAAIEKYGADLAQHPLGTGPYKLKSLSGSDSITLERFDGYWGGKPYLDEIEFVVVREDATRVTMLETGQADAIVNVPAQDIERLKKDSRLRIRVDPSNRVCHIGLNCLKKPFADARVRQALNYAIDREAIVKSVLQGVGRPADSVIAPVTWGHAAVSKYRYDPDRARQLLAEAGYPQGFETTLWTPQGRYFMDKQTAVAVQGQLEKVGVKARLETFDWSTYLAKLRYPPETSESEMYLLAWESVTGEVGYIASTVFSSSQWPKAGWNTMFYKNYRVDEIARVGMNEVDQGRRKELYREFQQIAVDEAPWILLHVFDQVTGLSAKVHGETVLPLEAVLFTKSWKEK